MRTLPVTRKLNVFHTSADGADYCRRLRLKLGWTQTKLAEEFGLCQPTVAQWEGRHHELKPRDLMALKWLETVHLGATA